VTRLLHERNLYGPDLVDAANGLTTHCPSGQGAAPYAGGVTRQRGPEDKGKRPVAKLFMLLFGLAGLGVGVWVFSRKRKVPESH
jgi:hypothetical protein